MRFPKAFSICLAFLFIFLTAVSLSYGVGSTLNRVAVNSVRGGYAQITNIYNSGQTVDFESGTDYSITIYRNSGGTSPYTFKLTTPGSSELTQTFTTATMAVWYDRTDVGTFTAQVDTSTSITFTMRQVAASCSYDVPASIHLTHSEQTTYIEVNTQSDCIWGASESSSWITITDGLSGTGDGVVELLVEENTGSDRDAVVSIHGETVTIYQDGPCAYDVNPDAVEANSTSQTWHLVVDTESGCPWTATESSSWLSITSGAQGTGIGTVVLEISENTGSTRYTSVTIAGKTVPVVQSGAEPTYNITSSLKNIDGISAPASGTRFILYTSPERSISGMNPAVFNGVLPGTYLIEGYQTGTFFGEEFWHSQNVTIGSSSTSVDLTRTYPHCNHSVIIRKTSDNSQVVTGQELAIGTEVRAEVTITNAVPGVDLDTRVRFITDISRSSPYNYDSGYSSPQTISRNGGVATFNFTYTVSEAGQAYYALEVQSLIGTSWVRTDSWDWVQAFIIHEGTGDPYIVFPPLTIPDYPDQVIHFDRNEENLHGWLADDSGTISFSHIEPTTVWEGGPIGITTKNAAAVKGIIGIGTAANYHIAKIRIPFYASLDGNYTFNGNFISNQLAECWKLNLAGAERSAYFIDQRIRIIDVDTEKYLYESMLFDHDATEYDWGEALAWGAFDIAFAVVGLQVGLPGVWDALGFAFSAAHSSYGNGSDPALQGSVNLTRTKDVYLEEGKNYALELQTETFVGAQLGTGISGFVYCQLSTSLQAVTLSFVPVNIPDIGINSSPNSIEMNMAVLHENEPAMALAGALSTVDPDNADVHVYSLVSGTGSADNEKFVVEGRVVMTKGPFDYEEQQSYTIRIRSTDTGGLYVENQFLISIIDEPESALNVPVLNSPQSGLGSQDDSVTLEWDDTNNSVQETGYHLRIRRNGEEYQNYALNPDVTSLLKTNLIPGETYSWNVRAIGNGSTTYDSDWANSGIDWVFTVGTTILQGTLQISLGPSDARTSGARWRIDGGDWKESGAFVPGLTTGISHVVDYRYLLGWVAPPAESVTFSGGETIQLIRDYSIAALPDLRVESLTLIPNNPTTETYITFTAVVVNHGSGASAASVALLQISGEASGTSFNVPALEAGASYSISTTPIRLTTAGPYEVTAATDYTGIVNEADETNNGLATGFVVVTAGNTAHKVVYSSNETGNGEVFVICLDSALNVISKINVSNQSSAEGYPRWSPNGDMIAFQSDHDGTAQTWVMNADGSNKRRITNESLAVVPICWSNDGQSIFAAMASPGDGEVVRVDVATGVVTVMTSVLGFNTQSWDLNPDQSTIAYVRGVQGNGFTNQLYVADFEISGTDFVNKVFLPDASPAPHSPRFSPSGTRIAVHLDNASPWGQGIGIIDTDGTGFFTPIPIEGYVNETPEWVDENRIIYAHGAGASNLYILNLNDMTQKQITTDAGYQGMPDVFTYAQTLPAYKAVYSSNETGDGEIFVLYLDAELNVLSKVNVSNQSSGEGCPRWSPNGELIAYQSNFDGSGQTWVMNADGSNKRRVTNESLAVVPICWSNDGQYIYAAMANPGDGEVVRVDVVTGSVTIMTSVSSYNTQSWDLNSDQSKIAYVRGLQGNGFSNQLYVADFEISGTDFINRILLPDAIPAPHSPRFSPSGAKIAVHLDRSSPWGEGIGIIDTDGSDFWTPIPIEGFLNQTPEWIDENRIVYSHGTNPAGNLYVLNLNDMTQKQITTDAGYQGMADVMLVSNPDLTVTLTHAPLEPTTADNITFSAVVTNTGGSPSMASILELRVGGETTGTQYEIPALAPGASYSPAIPPVTLGTPGAYRATAIADFTGVVPESNELNNTDVDDFTVYVPVVSDLVVESLLVTPPYPIAGENIRFTAEVRNIGTGPAGASTMRMWVGGETVGTDHPIPALNPGESYQVTRDTTLSANAYRTTAQADFAGVVGEADEANNQNFVDFEVISADLVAHKLVYSSNETGDGEIFVIALDSNLDVLFKYNVTNQTSGESYPRWSPNGDLIAFQSDHDGSAQTWVMNADGSNKRRVTDESLAVVPVSWSADSQYIYALMAYPGDGEVVRVDVATGAVTGMTDVSGYNTQSFDLNERRTKVAYVRGYEGDGFSNQLYWADFTTIGGDFTNSVLLPDAVPAPHQPRLSPAGTRIAVHLDRSSPWGQGIGIIGTDGSGFWTPVPVEGYVNETPEWVDENRIVFTHGTNPAGNLYVLNLTDMTQKQITGDIGYQGYADIFSYAEPPQPYSRKVDFNSDGREDILWRYYGTGGYQGLNLVWLMGQTGSPAPMNLAAKSAEGTIPSIFTDRGIGPKVSPPATKSILARDRASAPGPRLKIMDPMAAGRASQSTRKNEADTEARREMLARTDAMAPTTLGANEISIAAVTVAQEIILSQIADTTWEIAGTGDFNSDGKTDILWRNYGTGPYQGLNDIWFMDGTTFVGEAVFSQIADLNWRIAGTGDFNGDGQTDILWRYYGTGAYQGLNVVWFMNGAQFAGEAVFSQVLDTAWKIEGTGDFNADGETDILWRYYGTGAYQGLNDIWFMNDTTFVSEAVFSQILDTNWQIGGTGDFNNDGHLDILWRYYGAGPYQGMNDIWYMNGMSFVSEEIFSIISDTNWRIVNR